MSSVPTFSVTNFGCRATQADGFLIERELLEQGFRQSPNPGDASLVVLNTCTVTESADQDVRATIRRIHRENPQCKILVTGCYAQRAPEELAALPGVSWVVGNSHKHKVAEVAAAGMLAAAAPDFVALDQLKTRTPASQLATMLVGDIGAADFAHTELRAAPWFELQSSPELFAGSKTRPILKIQDGCNNRCSFCIIPSVRGKSRSLPLNSVIAQVQALVDSGYREIVLSGINLGRWGRDLESSAFASLDPCGTRLHSESGDRVGRTRFVDLLRMILKKTSIERLRISSVEPMDWSDELIALVAESGRIAKHAHLPLQSGSDRILRRMHRKYRPWHYADRIQKIRALMPLAAIGADVMTGFPGETEDLFEESRSFIASLPFTYLHVFTYSSRPGTPSASMAEQVPVKVARERNRILRELAEQKNRQFRESLVGSTVMAITLGGHRKDDDGLNSAARLNTEAISDNYLKIQIAGKHEPNQWLPVEISGISRDGLCGVRQ